MQEVGGQAEDRIQRPFNPCASSPLQRTSRDLASRLSRASLSGAWEVPAGLPNGSHHPCPALTPESYLHGMVTTTGENSHPELSSEPL